MSPQFVMKCGLADYRKSLEPESKNCPYWQKHDTLMCQAQSEIDNVNWFPSFYDGTNPVLTANWNYVSKRTYSLLERMGFECEWSDQVTGCDNCYLAVYNTAQCYGDTSVAKNIDTCNGGIITLCPTCAVKRFEEVVLPSLINNPNSADTLGMDLSSYGFTRHTKEYESGFHPGQTDNPKDILKSIHELNPTLEVVFQIEDIGQFDIRFTAWTREKDED